MPVARAGLDAGRHPPLILYTALQNIGWKIETRWSGMSWLGTTGDACWEGFVILGGSAGLGREGVMGSVRRSLMSSLNHTHPSHNFSFSKAWPVCVWAKPVGILTCAWDLIDQYDRVMTQHGQCHWKKNLLLTIPKRRGTLHHAGPHTEESGLVRRQEVWREIMDKKHFHYYTDEIFWWKYLLLGRKQNTDCGGCGWRVHNI